MCCGSLKIIFPYENEVECELCFMQWLIVQYLIQQTAHSVINNYLLCMPLLHVSTSTRLSSGRCIQVQQILWKMCTCRVKIQHCWLKLLEVFFCDSKKKYFIFHCWQTPMSILSSFKGEYPCVVGFETWFSNF